MNYEEIKAKIDYLEDRVITNFETYFSYLVLQDFYEGGYNNRVEDEFLYEEYFSQYEDDIVNLLLLIQGDSLDDFTDFKLRLIKMKRKIDTLLAKVEIEDDEITNRKQRRNPEFLLNQNLDKDNFIEFLHTELNDNKLIEVSFDEFKKHFDENCPNRIQWFGTELQISNLINSLIDKKYLDNETHKFKYLLIASHFLNKNGNLFKVKQLGAVYADKWEMIRETDIISKIIENISTHFSTHK